MIWLEQLVKDKSVALVGSAASLLEQDCAQQIDAHEVVIRMNLSIPGQAGPAAWPCNIIVYIATIAHAEVLVRTIKCDGIGHGRIHESHPLEAVIGTDLVIVLHACQGLVNYKIVEHILRIMRQLLSLQAGCPGYQKNPYEMPDFHPSILQLQFR